jgi:hypothetical protein
MGSPRRGQSRARWAIIRQVTAVRVCVSVCLTRCPRWLCLGGAARRARRESDRHSPGRCRHERSADRPASKVRKPETHHNGLIGALDRRNPATSPHARNRSARNHLRARGPSGNPEFVRRMIIIIQGLEHLAPLSGRPGSQGLLEPHSAQSQETLWPAWNLVRVATSTPGLRPSRPGAGALRPGDLVARRLVAGCRAPRLAAPGHALERPGVAVGVGE